MVSLNLFMILFSATRSFLVYTDRPKNINDVENKVYEGSEKTSAKTISSTMGWDPFGGSKINGSSHFLKEFKNISIFCANNIPANKNQNSVHFFLLNYQNVILDGKVLSLLEACFDLISGSSLSMKIQIMGGKITENLGFKSPLQKVKTFLFFFLFIFKFFTQNWISFILTTFWYLA